MTRTKREVMHPADDGGGDDLIEAPLLLTPKEEMFCRLFGDPESDTYSRGTLSAAAAGFVQPHSAQWKLRQRPRIIARLEEFQEAASAAIGKVLTDLEHTRQKALEKGDLAVATRCSELQGRHLGAFFERSLISLDTQEQPVYDALLAVEASRLARLALEDAGAAGLGVLPASADGQRRELLALPARVPEAAQQPERK